MKKLLLFITAITLFIGCKKDKDYGLKGTWRYSGETCFCAHPDNIGTQTILLSFENGSYKSIINGQVISTGGYSLMQDRLNGQIVNRIVYDGATPPTHGQGNGKIFFKIEGDKLTFYGTVSTALDGTEEYYQRQ